ncbi:MAG: 2-hydroxy-acid oxidase [Candidatus Zixiibacteriota bacterium]|nr:MAG: 2-hydroxy-acid oxidase [candidate division Zixibacteria bacterium]
MTFIEQLKSIVPSEQYSDHADSLEVVSKDESTIEKVIPIAVVWAKNSKEIIEIVKLCYDNKIPITTRGSGSALEGSTIPDKNGIVLDLSQMTDIIEYWQDDLQVKVQPGLIYDNLNEKIKRDGLFFPPSPGGSGDVASIGGMVSTNASGIYSVKYGGTKDYILELEIVTGRGEFIKLGNRAIKRSSGYNLVDLICSSEGTLGVITSITMKLSGLPEDRFQTAFKFTNEIEAAQAVSEIRKYGIDVAALEFLDKRVMQALNQLKDYELEEVPCLFLEFHGPRPTIDSNLESVKLICEELNGQELKLADGLNPWEVRHFVTDAIKHLKPGYTIIRNDVAFPISHLPEMVELCYKLGDENNILIHTFGHVGMGLLHALLLADKSNQKEWGTAIRINDEIIKRTIELNGTISGEHGIGIGHKNLIENEHGLSVEYMKKIKKQFDPANILNPGKIFDIY